MLGTAGLPHILMRFFTVPNAKAARSSVVWAMFLIGFFYLLTTVIGFGARAILGEGGVEAAGSGGNLAAPNLAQELGGGEGTFGGDLFLAVIAGVAFATILAVVAGLVLSSSAAVSHDIWSSVIRKGKDSEQEEVWVAEDRRGRHRHHRHAHRDRRRGGAERLVHGRPRVRDRGQRELPGAAARAHLAALQHGGRGVRRARRRRLGAAADHHQPDRAGAARPASRTPARSTWYDLNNPGIISIPLGFLGCILGTLATTRAQGAERTFHELYVRSETGLGAEKAITH